MSILDKDKIKKKIAKSKFSGITKEISREVRNIKKLKIDKKSAKTPEEKKKVTGYIETLKEKIDYILEAMTKEKMDAANLAQMTKALRTLAEAMIKEQSDDTVQPNKRVNVNINIDNLNKQDLLELLGKKSQEYKEK